MREIELKLYKWLSFYLNDRLIYNAITDRESRNCAYRACLYASIWTIVELFLSFIGQNCGRSVFSYSLSLVLRNTVTIQQIVAPFLKLFETMSKLYYLKYLLP